MPIGFLKSNWTVSERSVSQGNSVPHRIIIAGGEGKPRHNRPKLQRSLYSPLWMWNWKRPGWCAADSGAQAIRLVFDESQTLKHIALVFEETDIERTQEFVLRWSGDYGGSFQEIVRQQWNFSPPNSIAISRSIESNSQGSTFLNWTLCPNISGGVVLTVSSTCSRGWLRGEITRGSALRECVSMKLAFTTLLLPFRRLIT